LGALLKVGLITSAHAPDKAFSVAQVKFGAVEIQQDCIYKHILFAYTAVLIYSNVLYPRKREGKLWHT
jgi:hypothetical protein